MRRDGVYDSPVGPAEHACGKLNIATVEAIQVAE
jgi:hypothetical protein